MKEFIIIIQQKAYQDEYKRVVSTAKGPSKGVIEKQMQMHWQDPYQNVCEAIFNHVLRRDLSDNIRR